MVHYGITPVPLAEELRASDPGIISPFYTYLAAFNVLAWRRAYLLKLLMEKGPDRGYLPDPDRSQLIADSPY